MKQNRSYWDSLADNYCDKVISPFYDVQTAKLFYKAVKDLHTGFIPDRKRNQKNYAILEVGCGKGLFFDFLQRGWEDVPSDHLLIGVDSSPKMIRHAQENLSGGSLVKGDYNLLPFKSSGFDEIYSINSLLVPERENRLKFLGESFRALKAGGIFTGLFPSNENHLEQAYAMKERFLQKQMYTDEDEALHAVYKALALRGYDPVGGFIDTQKGEMRQKLYAKYELEDLLETTGFTLRKIAPFYYPISVIKHFDLIVRKNILYDWLLLATKG